VDCEFGEVLILNLGFLKAENVRLMAFEPVEQDRKALPDGINVPGCDFQGGAFSVHEAGGGLFRRFRFGIGQAHEFESKRVDHGVPACLDHVIRNADGGPASLVI